MHLKLQEEYLTRKDVQFCSVLFVFANKRVMPFLCVTPSLPFTLNVSTISCTCPWNLPRDRLQDDDFLRKILKCVLKRMERLNKFTTLHKSGGWLPWHWEFPSFHFWTILFGFAAAWCAASKMYFTEIWFGQVLIFGGFLANWFHPLYFAFSTVIHNYAKIFVTSASQML